MSTPKLNLASSIELANDLRAHKDKMENAATSDAATGTISVDKEFFKKNMPEGVTVDSYKAAMAYRDLTLNAGALLATEVGVTLMHGNKDLQRVELTVPTLGGSKLEGVVKRDKSYPDGNGGMTHTKGALSGFAYTDRSSRGADELKNIKRHLTEIAVASLSD